MKRTITPTQTRIFILALYTLLPLVGWGQVTLTGTSYAENFDGVGSGLPTGWSVRTGATASSLGTTQTFVTTATAWANTTGQFQNSAAAESPSTSADNSTIQSGRTDRVIAIRQSGTVGDPGAAFIIQLANTIGFSDFDLSFKLMQLDPGAAARTSTWNVDYGFGATPATFTNATTMPATLTTTLGTWGSTNVTVNFGSALNNNIGPVWIRIVTKSASSGSGSRPVTAIDDFSLTWTLAATPSIAISTSHPASTNISQGSNNNILASYQLDVTDAASTLNSISVNTAGTYTAADIATNGFKFWINSTNNLTGATQLGASQPAVGPAGTVAVSGLSQNVPIGTRYVLVTADIASGATLSNTIRLASTAFSNITFASGTKSGTDPAAASNDMTIIACSPTNATGLTLTPGSAQLAVSWTNPPCLDEVMIVAKATSSIIATPTGDGSLYTANLAFGSGTAFDGGYVVYKGAASPQTITGLTNGTTYFVKVFTRRGTTWTSGVEASVVPGVNIYTWSTTTGSSAWANSNNWTGGPANTYPGVDTYTTSTADGASTDIANFTTLAFTGNNLGLNFNNTTSNNGVSNNSSFNGSLTLGALHFSGLSKEITFGKSDGSALGSLLTLNGGNINSLANTVIRQNSTFAASISGLAGGTGENMRLAFGNVINNIIVVDNSANLTISCVITSASGPITITGSGSGIVEFSGQNTYTTETVVAGSTLRLNRTGGNTLPATNNIKVEGGTLRISTSQTINNLTLTGGTITIDPGVTFTINGTVTRTGGSIDASATGATIVFGNSTPITLPAGLFSGAIQNLTISGTGGVTVGSDLTVNGVLNLASGFLSIGARTLTLNGTTSGSGGIRGGNTSNLVIGGSGSINLRMDQTTPGTTNRLANFTYNKNTTLLDTLEVTGVITPTAGQLNTGDVLKLISTSSGTAHIATGSGSYITGKVTAERFVPATGGRRWRFMSSPVANATIEDWRGEIFVTGGSGSTTLGTTNTGGFDASPNNNTSIFSYDETNTDPSVNAGWVAPTATTEALTPGKGFRVFVRGDRSNTAMLTNSPPAMNAVTVNVVGSVNSGNIDISISCTPSGPGSTYNNNSDGWNLLGNPYPSDYDWNAFYDANKAALDLFIEPTVWVYNASTGTYSSYNAALNGGSLTNGIIPSGAAFWVKSNVLGNHTITLTEAFKTNAQAVNVFKHTEDAGFVVRMVRDSINSSELHIKYKTGATTNFDRMDIRHLPGTVNIAAYGSDSIRLAASARPLTTLNDTIRLDVSGSNGSYTFTFINPSYIDVLDEVYLIDNHLSQVVNLKQTNQYVFSIASSTPATFGANRFMIVVANANPVPVSLAVFNAKVVGQKQVALDWVTVSELNSSKFEVEHSTNGKQFNTIGNVKAQGNSAKIYNYRFIHKDAAAVNYYRLKMIDMDGSFTTSVVRMVRFDGINESEISLWPIPASQQISVNGVSNEEPVGYMVTDAMGQTVLTGMWSAHTTHELWIENLPQGMYFIKLNSETSNNTFRFIKQ